MELELRVVQLERQNRNQRAGLAFLAVVLCGLVTVAANRGEFSAERGEFETLRAKFVIAENFAAVNKLGNFVVGLGANDLGDGYILTSGHSTDPNAPAGTGLVEITSSPSGGLVNVKNNGGNTVVQVLGDQSGNGKVSALSDKGDELASIKTIPSGSPGAGNSGFVGVWHSGENRSSTYIYTDETGGKLNILDKTEELAVDLYIDENGNGGVWTSAERFR